MKNLIITLTFIILAITTNAQVIGTVTHTIEGGIKGTATQFTPTIELYALNGENTLNTLIFNDNTVSTDTTITIYNTDENTNFEHFIQTLTSSTDHLLRVGHNIRGVKTRNAASISGWFGENTDFIGEDVSHITITYTKVQFETENNWTFFGYEMTLEVHGVVRGEFASSGK